MEDLTSQSWFWWTVGLVVAAPLLLVTLSELVDALEHRGSVFAKPVRFLRSIVLPIGWLVLLLTQVVEETTENDAVRIAATVLGFCLMLLALSILKAGLFASAERTSWRGRLPSIFVDLARVLMIAIGTAILLSVVWGTNVGGLIAALGVTSIVIGLALQHAVGNIVSGLLLLFEQPFEIGDWLEIEGTTGRVVEVNWRSLHLDVGNAIHIVPNGSLADASFDNLSRPSIRHNESVQVSFASDEPPNAVKAMLNAVAAGLPGLEPATRPSTSVAEYGDEAVTYATSFTVSSIERRGKARDEFLTRAWYGARRQGLRLVGLEAAPADEPERVAAALREAASTFYLTEEDIAELAPQVRIEEYAAGEEALRAGDVPPGVRYILQGRIDLRIDSPVLGVVTLEELASGEYFGARVLTREPARSSALAVQDVELLLIPHDSVRELLDRNHRLLRDLEEVRERRSRAESEAIEPSLRPAVSANGAATPS